MMLLRNSAAPRMTWPHFFCGRRGTLETWDRKIAKRIGTRLSPQHSVSMFEGSLAEVRPFLCYQLRKLRKSGRIAALLVLSTSKFKGTLAEKLRFSAFNFQFQGSLAE